MFETEKNISYKKEECRGIEPQIRVNSNYKLILFQTLQHSIIWKQKQQTRSFFISQKPVLFNTICSFEASREATN